MFSLKKAITGTFIFSLICVTFSAEACASPIVKRIQGEDRYKTSSAISKESWKQANYAVLVTGENYPDALCSAPLAKKYNGPVLLTENNTLNCDTKNELTRLNTKKVFIIGGEKIISKNIETQLKNMKIKYERICGKDRYETSIKIAEKLEKVNEAFVTPGDNFIDALSAASIASKKEIPILLTRKDYPTETFKKFVNKNDCKYCVIENNPEDISSSVTSILKNKKIIKGSKYNRNLETARLSYEGSIFGTKDTEFRTVYMATGKDYPDALSGAVLASQTSSPIILSPGCYFSRLKEIQEKYNPEKIVILGGKKVVNTNFEYIPTKYHEIEYKNHGYITVKFSDILSNNIDKNKIILKSEQGEIIPIESIEPDSGSKNILVITPSKKLSYDTKYDLFIPKDTIKSISDTLYDKDINISFKTLKKLKIKEPSVPFPKDPTEKER